jgi:hypothetical protein
MTLKLLGVEAFMDPIVKEIQGGPKNKAAGLTLQRFTDAIMRACDVTVMKDWFHTKGRHRNFVSVFFSDGRTKKVLKNCLDLY